MQHGDAFAESRAHQTPDPQRERDFGNQDDGRLAARKRRFDRAEIDFRLAAAGDAVNQPGREFAGHQPAPDFSERFFLFGVQHVRGRNEIRVPRIFARRDRLFPGRQHARFFQAPHDGAGGLGFFEEMRERQRPARGGQDFTDAFFVVASRAVPRCPGRHATICCTRVLRGRSTSRAER